MKRRKGSLTNKCLGIRKIHEKTSCLSISKEYSGEEVWQDVFIILSFFEARQLGDKRYLTYFPCS